MFSGMRKSKVFPQTLQERGTQCQGFYAYHSVNIYLLSIKICTENNFRNLKGMKSTKINFKF